MVKDAGDDFRQVLRDNIPFIDHWTILDTGSTDNTVSIIKEELGDIPGQLYQEPFINFRDSRNRLLELAGTKFAFNIMLDDTYVLNGRVREFLTYARADDEFQSLSIFIKNPDVLYSSNRITKPERHLKYIYTIHEIIQKNYNGCMPLEYGFIEDHNSPYMSQRTIARKYKDLELLFEEIKKNPEDARLYYYTAETYLCLEKWQEAIEYYELRVKMDASGFREETQDSLYKIAVIAHINLGPSYGYTWEKCQQLYMNCYEYDPNKPEAPFMIGKTLVEMGHKHSAYLYLKRAFEVRDTYNTMNNRIKISNYYVPYYLLPLAREYKNGDLADECEKMLQNYSE
jgi:tetratricopeptide (TPR) repeat protein